MDTQVWIKEAREAGKAAKIRRVRRVEFQEFCGGAALVLTGWLFAAAFCLLTHRLAI